NSNLNLIFYKILSITFNFITFKVIPPFQQLEVFIYFFGLTYESQRSSVLININVLIVIFKIIKIPSVFRETWLDAVTP
ncbi:hypothetical protein, partial [Bacillus wiedmannii]|uniref:hypothetical protein n=1 Tax=Bacillus wiedmannii TaxID=1890302 RepID=UPI001A9554E5